MNHINISVGKGTVKVSMRDKMLLCCNSCGKDIKVNPTLIRRRHKQFKKYIPKDKSKITMIGINCSGCLREYKAWYKEMVLEIKK